MQDFKARSSEKGKFCRAYSTSRANWLGISARGKISFFFQVFAADPSQSSLWLSSGLLELMNWKLEVS